MRWNPQDVLHQENAPCLGFENGEEGDEKPGVVAEEDNDKYRK